MWLNFLYAAVGFAFLAVALFVWTVVRTAVRDLVNNTRRPKHRAGDDWTADPDAPVPFHTVPLDEPLYGRAAAYVQERLAAREGGAQPTDELRRKAY